MRPTTVVVTAVSSAASAASIAAIAGRAANVTAVSRSSDLDEAEAAQAVWAELERVNSTYALTDVDPLEALCRAYVEAWRRRRLELFDAAALEVRELRGRADFYFVLDDGSPEGDLGDPNPSPG